MSLEIQRRNIVHRILDISNPKLLNKIEELLDSEVYAYTTSGEPLSVQEYQDHLNKIMTASDSGETRYTTEEARKKIAKK